MVIVPSLLSVICERAVLPEGIRTSPAIDSGLLSQWPQKFVFKAQEFYVFLF